jgi:hypothetical protein
VNDHPLRCARSLVVVLAPALEVVVRIAYSEEFEYGADPPTVLCKRQLWLKGDWGSADPLGLEVDSYLDAVGNLDERDATIHPVLLTVEGHHPFDRARASPLASN